MKKTINIHISRVAFTIEEDAYSKLSAWLDAVAGAMSGEPGKDEILEDIEMRAAELFTEYTEGRVVTIADVEQLISVMGSPEDFAASEEQNETETKTEPAGRKRNRQLFRDTDNRILGGVASGLGNYFNANPIVFRILFIVFTFVGVAGPIVYVLLWALVPAAVTRSQKLEMRGERVTIDSIGRIVNEEIQGVRESWVRSGYTEQINKATEGIEEILIVIAKVFLFILGLGLFVGGLVALVFIFSAFFSDQMLFFVNDIPGFVSMRAFFELFSEGESITALMLSALSLAVLPMLLVVYLGSKLLFKYKDNSKLFFVGGTAAFVIAMVFAGISALKILGKYKTEQQFEHKEILPFKPGDTLTVSEFTYRNPGFETAEFDLDDFKIDIADDTVKQIYGIPRLNIRYADTPQPYIVFQYRANGLKLKASDEMLKHINYKWELHSDSLRVMPYFTTAKKQLHFESLDVNLYVPGGLYVHLDSNIDDLLWIAESDEDIWIHEMLGETLIMTEKGMKFSN